MVGRRGATRLAARRAAAGAPDAERAGARYRQGDCRQRSIAARRRSVCHKRGLTEMLLQMVFRRACFADLDAPRARGIRLRGRSGTRAIARLLGGIAAGALLWFTEARAIRRALDDSAPKPAADAAVESREHLQRLFMPTRCRRVSGVAASVAALLEGRGAALAARRRAGVGSPHIVRELRGWSERHRSLAAERRRRTALDSRTR